MKRLAESPYRQRGKRDWTADQRAAQAARCRRRRPWLKSTGPRSPAGRARCSANGLRHGLRSAPLREVLRLLAAHRRALLRRRRDAGITRVGLGSGGRLPGPYPAVEGKNG